MEAICAHSRRPDKKDACDMVLYGSIMSQLSEHELRHLITNELNGTDGLVYPFNVRYLEAQIEGIRIIGVHEKHVGLCSPFDVLLEYSRKTSITPSMVLSPQGRAELKWKRKRFETAG